jgi:hypothetical protein
MNITVHVAESHVCPGTADHPIAHLVGDISKDYADIEKNRHLKQIYVIPGYDSQSLRLVAVRVCAEKLDAKLSFTHCSEAHTAHVQQNKDNQKKHREDGIQNQGG